MNDVSKNCTNFVDIMMMRAVKSKDDIVYTFLKNDEEIETLTYAALEHDAKNIAARLQNEIKAGDRVILLFPAGLAFIKAFFGCLYAGVIAIPLPMPTSKDTTLLSLSKIIEHANVSAIMTLSSVAQQIDFSQIKNILLFNVDTENFSRNKQWKKVEIKRETIAFLQYTSGSTGAPKGVMVSHDNLLHNEELIQSSFKTHPKSVFVGWLPHYHDMGLIGNILHPVYSGCQLIFMAPMTFLQKPFRWLYAISKYKGTISGAPNFAYELCVNRITEAQKQSLNLESWVLAFNGAESVRPETIERFTTAFSCCGFSKNSMYPTYGLAESTLFVTGGECESGPFYLSADKDFLEKQAIFLPVLSTATNRQLVVSVGRPWLNQTVFIVHPNTCRMCADKSVGEIWIKGPSVTQGYWHDAIKTKAVFHQYIHDLGIGPCLRTGDLGFMHEGNLYITGRIKDLIIIRGRNFYPDDIEHVAQTSHPALRASGTAAFSIDIAYQEQLILVQEVERTALKNLDKNQVIQTIRRHVLNHFNVNIHTIVLIMPHRLPKTSSGKVKRQETKKVFLNNGLMGVISC